MILTNVAFCLIFSMVSSLLNQSLTVVSDRVARVFNRSRATQAVALDMSKAFDRIWPTRFFQSLVVLDAKYSQEYPENAGVP